MRQGVRLDGRPKNYAPKQCVRCGRWFKPRVNVMKSCESCRTCSVSGCDKAIHANGICGMHSLRMKKRGSFDLPTVVQKQCTAIGCDRLPSAKGLCSAHAKRARKGKAIDTPIAPRPQYDPVCIVGNCRKYRSAGPYCSMHYARVGKGISLELENLRDPNRKCVEVGCTNKHHSRGFCKRHYYIAFADELSAKRDRRRQLVLQGRAHYDGTDLELSIWCRRAMRHEADPCYYCGAEYVSGGFHIDHVIPLASGGSDDWTNYAHACARCNLRKGTKTEQEFFALLEAERTNSTT